MSTLGSPLPATLLAGVERVRRQRPDKPAPPKNVRRKAFLGGLLNHYYVDKAA